MAPNPEKELNQVRMTLIPATSHSQRDSAIILVGDLNEYKVYQVKDNKIQFISTHRYEIPIDGEPRKELTANNSITYVFKKLRLQKTEKNVKFFSENEIEWDDEPSSLLFRFEFAIGAQKLIKPQFIGEIKKSKGKVIDYLDNFKPVLGPRLSVIAKKTFSGFMPSLEIFLAEDLPGKKRVARPVFKINKCFANRKNYYNRLQNEQKKIPEKVRSHFRFNSDFQFFMSNPKDEENQKVTSFVNPDRKMLTIGLIDTLSKKLIARRLVSIYDIFEGVEWLKIAEEPVITVSSLKYSTSTDTLFLQIEIDFEIKPRQDVSLKSIFDSEMKVGRNDRFRINQLVERPTMYEEENPFSQTRFLSVKIFNLFRGGELKFERKTVGNWTNFSCRGGNGRLITVEDGVNEFRIEILSPEEKCPKFSENAEKVVKNLSRVNFVMSYKELLKKSGISDRWIRKVSIVGGSQLLILFQTKMVLFDIASKEVLSTISYSKCLPRRLSCSAVEDDLILSEFGEKCYMLNQIHQMGMGGVLFRPIKTLDYRLLPDLHSINKFLNFRKTGENQFNLQFLVNWMNSKESTLTQESLLSCDIKLNRSKSGVVKSVENLDFQISEVNDSSFIFDEGVSSYIKNGWVYHKFLQSEMDARGMFKKLGDGDFKSIACQGYFLDGDVIKGFHIGQKYSYIVSEGYLYVPEGEVPVKKLRVIEFRVPGPEDEEEGWTKLDGLRPIQIKTKELEGPLYFDEKTDKFRIFYFWNLPGTSSLRLSVLNEELEEISSFEIAGLREVKNLQVISDTKVYVVGASSLNEKEENAVKEERSMLIDLEKKTFVSLVGQTGEPFFGILYAVNGGGFLTFSRSFKTFLNPVESEGIFISDDYE